MLLDLVTEWHGMSTKRGFGTMSLLRTEFMCCVLLCHEGIQRSRALGQ